MSIRTDGVIKLEPQYRLQWEPAQGIFVLLFPEGMIKLKGSAGEIMKRIDGQSTAEDLIAKLSEAFPGVDLRQDVLASLEIAYGKGWISIAGERA